MQLVCKPFMQPHGGLEHALVHVSSALAKGGKLAAGVDVTEKVAKLQRPPARRACTYRKYMVLRRGYKRNQVVMIRLRRFEIYSFTYRTVSTRHLDARSTAK